MTMSRYVRIVVKGKRRYVPVNKKKLYPGAPVFSLRYSRKSETLTADSFTAAVELATGDDLSSQRNMMPKPPSLGFKHALAAGVIGAPGKRSLMRHS